MIRDVDCSQIPLKILDRKSTRLNSSHLVISYAVFCLKKKIESIAAVADPVRPPGVRSIFDSLQLFISPFNLYSFRTYLGLQDPYAVRVVDGLSFTSCS